MATKNNHINTMKKQDEVTCIQLTKETRNKLAELGKKTDTYESIILDLMSKPCPKHDEMEAENENE